MSVDLAVWEGARPQSDALAGKEFERRTSVLDDDSELEPASLSIAAFIGEVLTRYPALGEPGDEESPWVTGPEVGDINGDFAYLTMSSASSEATFSFVVQTARKHGLVCYDPQTEALA